MAGPAYDRHILRISDILVEVSTKSNDIKCKNDKNNKQPFLENDESSCP